MNPQAAIPQPDDDATSGLRAWTITEKTQREEFSDAAILENNALCPPRPNPTIELNRIPNHKCLKVNLTSDSKLSPHTSSWVNLVLTVSSGCHLVKHESTTVHLNATPQESM